MGTYDEPCFEETHRISHFDIQNHILTFKFGPNVAFCLHNPMLTFDWGRIANYGIRNPILTFDFVSVLIKFSQKTSVLP